MSIFSNKNTVNAVKKRIDWIDALRGFLIFCVTLGHCSPSPALEKYIYSFHMFAFFFLSGFLFTVKSDSKKMIKNFVKKLFLPFLTWNTVSCFIGFLKTKDSGLFLKEFFVIDGRLSLNPPIWFLLVLFIAEVIFVLLRLYKHPAISLSAMGVCLILWILFGGEWVTFKLNLVPMALCFFISGYLFKPYIEKLSKIYVCIPLFVISIFFAMKNVRVVYTYGKFGSFLYCIPAAFAGTLFIALLFSSVKALCKLKPLTYLGQNSLIIMAMQFFVFLLIAPLSDNLFGYNIMKSQNSFCAFVISVITILLISILITVFKKFTYKSKTLKFLGESFGVCYDVA